mgnify:CR=1 FL=1
MVCVNQMGSSARVIIGANRKRFVTAFGSQSNTSFLSEALVRLPKSLASRIPRFCSGLKNMGYNGEALPTQEQSSIGDLLVLIIRCGISAENLTRIGAGESHQNGKRSTPAKNGSLHVLLCGNGTTLLAADASSTWKHPLICRSTYITSFRSLIRTCGLILQTWCFFANPATNSFIRGGM